MQNAECRMQNGWVRSRIAELGTRNDRIPRMRFHCTRVLFISGTMILSPGAGLGAELTDAKEVLKKADEAARKVESVSYTAKARSTGWLESRAPSAEGSAVL